MKKVLSILVITLMVLSIGINAFAATVSIDNIITHSQTPLEDSTANAFGKFGGTIINYVTNAAMVIAVVMIAILGIKYMMGSMEEKAEYKKSLVPLLVGAILVFGAATIAKIIVGLAGSFGA